MGDVTPYLDRITSEHSDQPDFMAVMAAIMQPLADNLAVIKSIPGLYDLDVAVGVQLDTVGLWIGRTRNITIPLDSVYFAFDTVGLGFDEGIWFAPFDPTTGSTTLTDTAYRALLKFTVKANQWDGTKYGAYDVWGSFLQGFSGSVELVDNYDMTMDVTFTGADFDTVTKALITSGEALLEPAGVSVTVTFA